MPSSHGASRWKIIIYVTRHCGHMTTHAMVYKLVHVRKSCSIYWKPWNVCTLWSNYFPPRNLSRQKLDKCKYIFIVRSVIVVKTWKWPPNPANETDWVNYTSTPHWNICNYFFLLAWHPSHKNDKANSVMKSGIKWCQKTSLTFIGLLLIFLHPHVFHLSAASLFSFLDITLHKVPRSSLGLQAPLEANAMFFELLSSVVFYCLPGIKVICAYDIPVTSLPELGQIHVWFAFDPRAWKSVV